MEDEMKAVGVVALAGAALGAGLAIGFGLRVMTVGAMIGLGAGVALGILAGTRPGRIGSDGHRLLGDS
jgi:hypothetical protein